MILRLFSSVIIRQIHSYARIVTIPQLETGKKVTVKGWVENVRKLKKNTFLDISDGSCCTILQVVVPKVLSEATTTNPIGVGDSLEITGSLGISPQGQNEILAEQVKIVGKCKITEGYPFTTKQIHPPEYVRDYLHLRPRISYMSSVFRIRHKATQLIQNYFNSNHFTYIHTPILTENDCEGAGEVFVVQPDNKKLLIQMAKSNIPLEQSFFDKKVYLSVSGQLSLEAMSHGLGNTYTLAPTFRAENSRSSLHLSEFYMLEAELAFCDKIEQLTSFIEIFLKEISLQLLDECSKDLCNCLEKLELSEQNFNWLHKNWPTITYDEAHEILNKQKSNLSTELNKCEGFSKEQELLLVKYFDSTPVFVINWPKEIKPFYMKTVENNETQVYAVDLLAPQVGELIGGSLREDNYDRLKVTIPEDLKWYLDLRKFGGIPTGGFGMGFERYLQMMIGIKNIRDVIPFPRYPHNCRM